MKKEPQRAQRTQRKTKSDHVVRLAFGQRRKRLANALKALGAGELPADLGLLDLRAENVSVEQYLQIAGKLAH